LNIPKVSVSRIVHWSITKPVFQFFDQDDPLSQLVIGDQSAAQANTDVHLRRKIWPNLRRVSAREKDRQTSSVGSLHKKVTGDTHKGALLKLTTQEATKSIESTTLCGYRSGRRLVKLARARKTPW